MTTGSFLSRERAEKIREVFGTPVYVYDLKRLRAQAEAAFAFPNAFGLTVRYSMKAASNAAILTIFNRMGLHFDACSGYEVKRALRAGILASKISLNAQEMPADFDDLYKKGIYFNACSLEQLTRLGTHFIGDEVGLRFNPGIGSGQTAKTNVGGPSSSFGIWHESLEEVEDIVEDCHLHVVRIHTHIGSGNDPEVWQQAAERSLKLAHHFPHVRRINLGGGFKVGRMPGELTTNLQKIGRPVQEAFEAFAEKTGRRLHLEIELGTYLVANSGVLLAMIQDKVSTGPSGFEFLKLDTGMTEILRPCLYGAQHTIEVLPRDNTGETTPYVVVGHCCESGDLLTPAPDKPDQLQARTLATAQIGDLCTIGDVGAYCASMAAKHYNSFPEAPEVLLDDEDEPHLIRRRQTLDQMIQNEMPFDF